MALEILVNAGSGNDLLPDDTKPLPGQFLPNLDAGYYPLKLKWGDIEITLWKNEFVNCVIM